MIESIAVNSKKISIRTRGIVPTLKTVADHLGLSASTVSLALRNHSRITEKTRERVFRAVKAVGYHPDPEISKLMSHLRTGWKPGFKSAIYALTTRSETRFSEYHADLVKGAQQRAEELGYSFILKRFDPLTNNRSALQRTLVSQGIEGLLLLPMASSISCDTLLDWHYFSVVSATYGVRSPEFHRVVPHQFNNVRLACSKLTALGYRRIGLIQRADFSAMVNHSFLAAVTIQNLLGPTQAVTPFLFANEFPKGLKKWFAQQKPDALIVDGEPTYRIVAKELGLEENYAIGVALTNHERTSALAGIDERGATVGRTAVDALAFKIQTGDKGIPIEPVVTLIVGNWIPAKSLQPSCE